MYVFDVTFEDSGGVESPEKQSVRSSYDDTKKLQDEAVKRKNLALANLTMAFTKKGSTLLVKQYNSEDWPRGLAHKVVSAFKDEHHPRGTISRVEMRGNLNDVIMKELDDPQELFDQLIATEDGYNNNNDRIKVKESDLLAVALNVDPGKYQGVMATEQIQKGDAITLESISTEIKTLFLTNMGKDDSEENVGGGVASFWFKGNCHNCGETGHCKFECPNKGRENHAIRSENGNGNVNDGGKPYRFNEDCNNCGKKVHKSAD